MDKVFEMYKTSRNLVFCFLSKEPTREWRDSKAFRGIKPKLGRYILKVTGCRLKQPVYSS